MRRAITKTRRCDTESVPILCFLVITIVGLLLPTVALVIATLVIVLKEIAFPPFLYK